MQDILAEKDDDDCDEITVAIEPHSLEATANTDCDSDASYDGVSCNPQHLPRRILLVMFCHLIHCKPLKHFENT